MAEMNDTKTGFRVGGLGEIAIRCADLERMIAFYRDVLGLTPLAARSGNIMFFDLGPGVAGHTQVLALFGPGATGDAPATGTACSLHHIALGVTPADQEAAIRWYEKLDQPYRIEHFDWIGWRGLFTADPEGNTVELVAKVKEPTA